MGMMNLKGIMKQKTLGTMPALGAFKQATPEDDDVTLPMRKPGLLKKKPMGAMNMNSGPSPMKGLAARLTGKY
jgi:hypothetical protein